jgi:hypothetical protein
MMQTVKDAVSSFGGRAIEVVDKVGRKRVLVGLAILGAAIGGTILVMRMVRGRASAPEQEATSSQSSRGGKGKRQDKSGDAAGVSAH